MGKGVSARVLYWQDTGLLNHGGRCKKPLKTKPSTNSTSIPVSLILFKTQPMDTSKCPHYMPYRYCRHWFKSAQLRETKAGGKDLRATQSYPVSFGMAVASLPLGNEASMLLRAHLDRALCSDHQLNRLLIC